MTVGFNRFVRERTNICFGGQMLTGEQLERSRPTAFSITWNRSPTFRSNKLVASLPVIASRFRVWEYNSTNIATWQKLNPAFAPQLLPICWSPSLRHIPKLDEEDIDVLFYGLPSAPRLGVFGHICHVGIKGVYACGLYGQARDSLISRAKILLNLNLYDFSHNFEIVRVSYLLANEKAVVSDIYPDSVIDSDLKEAVAFATFDNITAECQPPAEGRFRPPSARRAGPVHLRAPRHPRKPPTCFGCQLTPGAEDSIPSDLFPTASPCSAHRRSNIRCAE